MSASSQLLLCAQEGAGAFVLLDEEPQVRDDDDRQKRQRDPLPAVWVSRPV